MQSKLRHCTTDDEYYMLASMEGMDLHIRYPLSDILAERPKAVMRSTDDTLSVQLHTGATPPMLRSSVTAYRYGMYAIYPFTETILFTKDDKPISPHAIVHTDWIGKDDNTTIHNFSFPRPADAQFCVICLVVETREGEREAVRGGGKRGMILCCEEVE
jgi:hypothetical protein